VSDLLNAVRTQPPHQEILDIAEIISQTLRKCDIPSSVTVSLDIPAPLSLARADPMRLHQVLWNLITSDLEAMPRSGALAVRRKRIKPRIPCVSASRIAPSVLCRNSRQNCSSLFHRQGAPYRTVLAG
jgi:signal transduction histidine kinase